MQGIDAARGIAMILVCVSHVRVHFAETVPWLYTVLTALTRVATPTFLLLSGFVAAYVLAGARTNTRMTLFDRGLFVLLIGHFVLNLEDLRTADPAQWIIGRVTVTDAIGICLMSAVALHRLPPKVLAALGATLALLSWPVAMLIAPESDMAGHIGAVLFDLRSEANPLVDAAIVPYMGVFLIGMALSKSSLEVLRAGQFARMAHKLAWSGGAAVLVVAAGILAWLSFKSFGLIPNDPINLELIRGALDPRSKLPPGPSYLLFYGGIGLLIAAFCLISRPRALVEPLVNWVATIGRASLMCFVAQDWLLHLIPAVVGFENASSVIFWMLYLVFSVLLIHWLAARWDASGANRFLTLGLKRRTSTSVPPRPANK
jgi:Heparan-alpha-glucosaminide N-acetyltransferase, catalytic